MGKGALRPENSSCNNARMVCRLVLKAPAMAAMGMPGQQNEVSVQLKIANLNMTLVRPVSIHVR
jgi:hypothetical protein